MIRTKAFFAQVGKSKITWLGVHSILSISALVWYQFWGETALIIMAVATPICFLLFSLIVNRLPESAIACDPLTGLPMRDDLIKWADQKLGSKRGNDSQLAIVSVTIDDLESLEDRFGLAMRDIIIEQVADRLATLVRFGDLITRLGSGFAIGLHSVQKNETDILMRFASRLQSVFDEPFSDGPTRTYCTVSVGIAAESHVPDCTGIKLVAAAKRANDIAGLSGPGCIRIYSLGLQCKDTPGRDIAGDLAEALETGEISAWFQPQIQGASGEVIGFEALARWEHPEKGMISPASFLPDIERSGLSQRLVEVMLKQSLIAIKAWDTAGFEVKTVSVNFSSDELRNPRLPDFVRWELDRHDVCPNRLVVEILESVTTETGDDAVVRNVSSLGQLGCRIDLDDFGTGNTSFANIRRFHVGRIKIDRSLVTSVDRDASRARMLEALLTFSEKMKIKALVEGVETESEVATLRELGYLDMQGFAFARPMPLGDSMNWLEDNGCVIRSQTAPKAQIPA